MNIKDTPEAKKEEKRLELEESKLVELTGLPVEIVSDYTRQGFTAEEIISTVREAKQEVVAEKKYHAKTKLTKEIQEMQFTPDELSSLVKQRLAEKELEAIAPTTGFSELDDLINGFIPGHLYTLTGQTGIGKTALSCNFAHHVASQGKVVLYLALEPDNTVIDYLASIAAKKSFDDVTEEDYEKIPKGIKYFKKDKVDTPEKLIEILRREKRYDLVIVDHVGYFITDTNNPYQTQSNVIKQLAGIAKERRTAVLIVAHMRKTPVSKKKDTLPTMDDISGSAAFKQDSTDVLIAIRSPNPEDEFGLTYTNDGYLLVNKTKSGPNGSLKITFIDKHATIKQKEEFQWTP